VNIYAMCDMVAWRGEQLDLRLVDEAVDVRHVSGVGQAKLYPHLAGEGGGRRWLCWSCDGSWQRTQAIRASEETLGS
jgi:hypothetical protein